MSTLSSKIKKTSIIEQLTLATKTSDKNLAEYLGVCEKLLWLWRRGERTPRKKNVDKIVAFARLHDIDITADEVYSNFILLHKSNNSDDRTKDVDK